MPPPQATLHLRLWLLALSLLTAFTAPASASAPAPDKATAEYEVRFMADMIDHHAMAVEMGQMCLQKAVHPELLALCANIVNTQSQEIATMQSWLSSWYGVSYQPEMTNGMQQQMQRMMSMTPTEFEMEFLKMMIRHHWKAVVMSSTCVDRAYHEQLRGMCEDIIIAQTAEIQQMRTWLCEWYGLCNYGPKGRPE